MTDCTSPATYPEATLQLWWNNSIQYISDIGNFGALQDGKREYAIQLMMAHLLYLQTLILAGQVPGIVQASTIDKVQVTLVPPVLKSQFQWWLSTSPYGMALLALLRVVSAGGFYVGGSPVRAGFNNYPFGVPIC
jgi:hypothetical protein